jgi:hypothetical protein
MLSHDGGCKADTVMQNPGAMESLMIKRVLAACMALGLVGCASNLHGPPMLRPASAPPPPPPEDVGPDGFRASEFAWSTAIGANSIVGDVVHKGKSAGWTCAGQSAGLTPQTRYSTNRIRLLYGSSDQVIASVESVRAKNAAHPGGDYSQFSRSTTCDEHNAFAFRNLPDGGYFLFVRVTPRKQAADAASGTVIMHRVEVHGGTVQQVVLP